MTEFVRGKRYAFSIYGKIGEQSHFSGKVAGTIDGEFLPPTAYGLENHINIYPALPAEIRSQYEDNYKNYPYVMISDDGGNVAYVGTPWIQQNTIIEKTTRKLNIELVDFLDETADDVIKLLNSHGYKVGTTNISSDE